MTANKPEVKRYNITTDKDYHTVPYETEHGQWVKYSSYKALQAESELLLKHLQNLIDQTTPLEPVPGNPMWSRRIQLDEVIAERDSLRAEFDQLRAAIRRLCNIYVIDDYYMGKQREERLDRAVNRAIEAVQETTK